MDLWRLVDLSSKNKHVDKSYRCKTNDSSLFRNKEQKHDGMESRV